MAQRFERRQHFKSTSLEATQFKIYGETDMLNQGNQAFYQSYILNTTRYRLNAIAVFLRICGSGRGELRRRFPGVTDNTKARACARRTPLRGDLNADDLRF